MADCRNEIILPSKCLSQMADVVEIILKFLPGRSLETSAQVCCLWRDIVQRIRRSRGVLIVGLVHAFESENYKPVLDFSYNLNSLAMEPQVALLFSAGFSTSSERPCFMKEISKRLKSNQQNLPRRCSLVGCASLWVDFVGSGTKIDDILKDDDRKLSAPQNLIILIPRVDGVESCSFRLPLRDKYKSIGGLSSFLPKMDLPVKLVIAFAHPVSLGKLTGFAVKVKKEYGEKTVIVGCYSDCALFHSTTVTYNEIVGLVFAGHLNSVSIVIDGSNYIQMLENLHKGLVRIKTSGFSPKNAMGIIFSPPTHLRILKRSGLLKCQAFRCHFPDVPIVVVYGTAVYGCDTVELERTGMRSGGRDFLRIGSSILCMISLKSGPRTIE